MTRAAKGRAPPLEAWPKAASLWRWVETCGDTCANASRQVGPDMLGCVGKMQRRRLHRVNHVGAVATDGRIQ